MKKKIFIPKFLTNILVPKYLILSLKGIPTLLPSEKFPSAFREHLIHFSNTSSKLESNLQLLNIANFHANNATNNKRNNWEWYLFLWSLPSY
jgi:hypothetical protein